MALFDPGGGGWCACVRVCVCGVALDQRGEIGVGEGNDCAEGVVMGVEELRIGIGESVGRGDLGNWAIGKSGE